MTHLDIRIGDRLSIETAVGPHVVTVIDLRLSEIGGTDYPFAIVEFEVGDTVMPILMTQDGIDVLGMRPLTDELFRTMYA